MNKTKKSPNFKRIIGLLLCVVLLAFTLASCIMNHEAAQLLGDLRDKNFEGAKKLSPESGVFSFVVFSEGDTYLYVNDKSVRVGMYVKGPQCFLDIFDLDTPEYMRSPPFLRFRYLDARGQENAVKLIISSDKRFGLKEIYGKEKFVCSVEDMNARANA